VVAKPFPIFGTETTQITDHCEVVLAMALKIYTVSVVTEFMLQGRSPLSIDPDMF
jgi:hypothetical protein